MPSTQTPPDPRLALARAFVRACRVPPPSIVGTLERVTAIIGGLHPADRGAALDFTARRMNAVADELEKRFPPADVSHRKPRRR